MSLDAIERETPVLLAASPHACMREGNGMQDASTR